MKKPPNYCPLKKGPCILSWRGECLNVAHIPGQCPLVKPEVVTAGA